MKVHLTEAAGELLTLDDEFWATSLELKIHQLYRKLRSGNLLANGYLVEADRPAMEGGGVTSPARDGSGKAHVWYLPSSV